MKMGAGPKLKFYGLKTCDTCKKALKELASNGWEPDIIDVRSDGVSKNDLSTILESFGDLAINRASTTWRNLSDAEKAEDALSLLIAHPTLMKRPVIEHDGEWTIGWKPDAKAKWLGAA